MADGSLMLAPAARTRRVDPVVGVRLVTLAVAAIAYETTARLDLLYSGVVPSLWQIGRAIVDLLLSPGFYPHLGITAFEAVGGFAIGAVGGVGVGIVLAFFRFVGDVLHPWLLWLAPTPKIVFVPVLLLLFGIGAGSKVAMAGLSAFFPVFVATFAAARQVSPVLLRVVKSFHATTWQTIRYVYLPALVVPIIGSLRLGLGVAIIGTLLAEIKAAKMGLGLMLIESYNFFRIPEMYAILLIIFCFAFLANLAMDRLTARFSHP